MAVLDILRNILGVGETTKNIMRIAGKPSDAQREQIQEYNKRDRQNKPVRQQRSRPVKKNYNDSSVFGNAIKDIPAGFMSRYKAGEVKGSPYGMDAATRAAEKRAIQKQGEQARIALGSRDYSSRGPAGAARKMAKAGKLMDLDGPSKVPAIKSFYEDD